MIGLMSGEPYSLSINFLDTPTYSNVDKKKKENVKCIMKYIRGNINNVPYDIVCIK